MPLSKTIIAVLAVYYGVAKWNDYFTGLVYLKDRSLYPLQTVLREILATLQVDMTGDFMTTMSEDASNLAEATRIANVPNIVLLYWQLDQLLCYTHLCKNILKRVL